MAVPDGVVRAWGGLSAGTGVLTAVDLVRVGVRA